MAATYTPQREKRKQEPAQLARGGAGEWVIRPNGKFYDQKRGMWVLKCHGCGKPFFSKRLDAKTHSAACRKRVQRRTLKAAQSWLKAAQS